MGWTRPTASLKDPLLGEEEGGSREDSLNREGHGQGKTSRPLASHSDSLIVTLVTSCLETRDWRTTKLNEPRRHDTDNSVLLTFEEYSVFISVSSAEIRLLSNDMHF